MKEFHEPRVAYPQVAGSNEERAETQYPPDDEGGAHIRNGFDKSSWDKRHCKHNGEEHDRRREGDQRHPVGYVPKGDVGDAVVACREPIMAMPNVIRNAAYTPCVRTGTCPSDPPLLR